MLDDRDLSPDRPMGDEIFDDPSAREDGDDIEALRTLWDGLAEIPRVPVPTRPRDGAPERPIRAAPASARRWRDGWLRAAAVLLLAGGGLVTWRVMTGGPSPDPADDPLASVLAAAVAPAERTPARLAAVQGAYDATSVGRATFDALVRIAREDPSVPVRIAAVDALAWIADRAAAAEALGTLPEQASPLVQMALIERLYESSPQPDLVRRLLERPDLVPDVRARAVETLASREDSP